MKDISIYRQDKEALQKVKQQTAFLDSIYKKVPLRQRLWHIDLQDFTVVQCKMCPAPVKWTEKSSDYRTYCSSKCAHSDSAVKEKTANTCMERYGVSTTLKDQHTKEKIKNTCLQKYGTERAASSDVVKQKIKKTFNERYGGNPAKLQWVKDKTNETNFQKYGKKRQSQSHIPQNIIDLKNNKEVMLDWFKNKKMPVTEIAEALGVNTSQLCVHFKTNLGIDISRHIVSRIERQVREFIDSLLVPVEYSYRKLIPPKEIDIYFPVHKLAIEIDGLAWHCELRGKSPLYHKEKSDSCAALGVDLIHITDYEWNNKPEIVKSRIKAKLGIIPNKFYARKCQIREISATVANVFFEESHIRGTCVSKVRLGLFYDNILVAAMTFGKSRYNQNAEWELLRYATTLDSTVVGGASKLFIHFITNYRPKSVISYSDKRWNTGTLYKQLGFDQTGDSGPNYWYTRRYSTFESRVKYQKHKLAKKLETFNPELTEWENMVNSGFDRYWDCGNSVWLWESNSTSARRLQQQ